MSYPLKTVSLTRAGVFLAGLLLYTLPAQAAAPFVVNGDGTVTDTSTGLMWDQCPIGQSGTGCATGTASTFTWDAAFAELGNKNSANWKSYADWRLPSVAELLTIVKSGVTNPSIDTTAFPNTESTYFWSASADADNSGGAWRVGFSDGFASNYFKSSSYRVRLVRAGQYFGTFALTPGGVEAVTTTAATLKATSPVAATGYWRVVPRGATSPTPAQVIDSTGYSGTAASGNAVMTAKTETSFSIPGLAAGTAYDLYLVARYSDDNYVRSQLIGPLKFSTTAIAARSIVIDPATPTTLFAGLDGAGIYKSTDSGASWTAASVPADKKNVRALVLKPNDSTKLFAASYGGGMLQSTDSGATWSACSGQPGNLNLVSLTSDASGKLYAGSEAGVFKSTDDCVSWEAMSTGLP